MKKLASVLIVFVFIFSFVDVVASQLTGESKTPANPFIGKWIGEWSNIRGRLEAKGELVVKENGMLEFVFGNDPMYEFPYAINGDVLSFKSSSGKIREFRITKEGKLKGELMNPSSQGTTWVCVLDRVVP
jgi:hypothetical protein